MRYEIRAMAFGEILDAGFRVLRDHFRLLVGIASLIYVPFALLTVWISMSPGAVTSYALLIAFIPTCLLLLVAQPVVSAATTFAVGELYLGRSASLGQSLRAGFAILTPLLGTSLLCWLCITGGLILLLIPGIYMMLAFLLVWQVMVFERVFGMAAVRRSRELMRGNLLRGAGLVLIGMLMGLVIGGALRLVLAVIPFLGPLGSALAQAAVAAYMSTVAVLLYFDIRCRKEGFDIEHLTRVVAAQEGAAATPAYAPPAA